MQGGRSGRRACRTCQPTNSAVPMLETAVKIQPKSVIFREHRNEIGAPHQVRGMSDDLTGMGNAVTVGGSDPARADWARALWLSVRLAGNPNLVTDSKLLPRPYGSPRPPRS